MIGFYISRHGDWLLVTTSDSTGIKEEPHRNPALSLHRIHGSSSNVQQSLHAVRADWVSYLQHKEVSEFLLNPYLFTR